MFCFPGAVTDAMSPSKTPFPVYIIRILDISVSPEMSFSDGLSFLVAFLIRCGDFQSSRFWRFDCDNCIVRSFVAWILAGLYVHAYLLCCQCDIAF